MATTTGRNVPEVCVDVSGIDVNVAQGYIKIASTYAPPTSTVTILVV